MEQEHRPTAAVVLYIKRNIIDPQHFTFPLSLCQHMELRQPELSDPSPFPRLPRFFWRAGKLLAVALEYGDIMALPSQHHRGRKPDNTAA
jgi:hypothetical protein